MILSLVDLCLLNLREPKGAKLTDAIALYKKSFCIRARYHNKYNTSQFIIVPRYYDLDMDHIIKDNVICDKRGIPTIPLRFINDIDDSVVYISFNETDEEGLYSFRVSVIRLPVNIDEYILYTVIENKMDFVGYMSILCQNVKFYNKDKICTDKYTNKIFSIDERITGLPIQYISKQEIINIIKIENIIKK